MTTIVILEDFNTRYIHEDTCVNNAIDLQKLIDKRSVIRMSKAVDGAVREVIMVVVARC